MSTMLFKEYTIKREDAAGVAFLSCENLPDLFIAATEPEEIRMALDACLRRAMENEGKSAQVFTNGDLSGPTIHTVVKIAP